MRTSMQSVKFGEINFFPISVRSCEAYMHRFSIEVARNVFNSFIKLILMCTYELRPANLCLRAFRHDKFQLRVSSHSEGPGIWLSV